MTLLYLLDTNIVSYLLKGRSKACRERFIQERAISMLAISSVTAGEVLYGLDRVGAGSARRAALNDLFTELAILPWRAEEAQTYGLLRSDLERTGIGVSALDMLIAAHAVTVGAVLVSHDERLKNLRIPMGVEDWATDL